ncbi:hypothetical protein E3N88_30096 [Mikania micrantha]|uniref:Uncharacterized protein n=1 Tax=Mikania micrantha TaxID=192012 RepID=A0A5N6ML34_9ASTR|nr:hypothetical protein E3N88_30096 [Mikania micrantha]
MSSSDEMDVGGDDMGPPVNDLELGQQERMMSIIGEDTPWSRLFEMAYAPQYRLITVEFLSTFMYRPQAPDFQPQPGQPQRGADLGGMYVTRIARFNGPIDLEPAGMEAFHSVRLDRRTMQGMHIVQKFPQLGLRFSLEKGWNVMTNDANEMSRQSGERQ